ncbi:hypothetical protein [Microbacterium halotolerans]|uniref:nSTAND1 domain-containing NTPase n=1 Tax=Microbacterium halotolerans TaxID=246613 RepID=UPI000E6AA8E1|nr:hypothetical protein [Microbacterium halotolerans]
MLEDAAAVPNTAERGSERRERLEQSLLHGREGVAQSLNAARQDLGLSYRALEARSGVKIATLQGWLTGKYVPQTGMRQEFARLAAVLDVADPPGTTGGAGIEAWWAALRGTARPRRAGAAAPYPGMRPYDLRTASDFPGRAAQRSELTLRIEERLRGEARPLLIVTGRSGVGKSSLVAAAVAATDEPARLLTPSPAALPVLDAVLREAPTAPRVIVLDQAEGLWGEDDDVPGALILERITALQDRGNRIALVVVMRADTIAPATDAPVLRDGLERAHVVIGPITREDARAIVLEPAAREGIAVDPALVQVILHDAGAGPALSERATGEALVGALPLLSQTMRALWEQRTAPERITVADYHRAGSLSSSVERAAEDAYAQLGPSAQDACWPVLREMIRLDGAVPGRRVIPADRLTDPTAREVIAVFRDAHLLVSDDSGVTIGHDLLMTTWPRLTVWLASVQEWDAARRMLARYATLWDEAGRPDDLLSTGASLGVLDHENEADFTRAERDFLAVSRDVQNRKLLEAEAENARLKTSTRRFRIVTLVATSLAVVAIVLGISTTVVAGRLDQARAAAIGGEIAARSTVVAETMPGEAAQLAVAAHAVDETPSTRSTLLSVTAGPQPRRLLTHSGSGAVAGLDDLVAEGTKSHRVRLIDPLTGEITGQIETPGSHLYGIDMVETDGRRLLAATGEDVSGEPTDSCVWDITRTPTELGCVTVPSKSDSVALLDDGTGALFGGADGTIQRLRIEGDSATAMASVPGPSLEGEESPGAVMGLDAAAGTVIAATGTGAVAALTDPLGAAEWSTVLPGAIAQSATLSPDGSRFVIPTQAFTLELGDIDAHGEPTFTDTAQGFESWANSAVFLPDGRIVGVSSDQTLRFFSADGVLTGTHALPSLPTSIALAGSALATYTANGTTTLWPEGSFPAPTERGRIFSVEAAQGPNSIVATLGSGDGRLTAQRQHDDGTRTELAVPEIDVLTRYGIAVSPDGRFIATAGYGRMFVWRVGEDALSVPTVTETLDGALITDLQFSPNGTRISVADQYTDTVEIFRLAEDGSENAGVAVDLELQIPVTTGWTSAFASADTFVVHDGTWMLAVWDLAAGKKTGAFDLDGQRPATIVARPGHPTQIAYATDDLEVGIVDFSDPADPMFLARVSGLTDTPRDMSFSSDGSRLAVAAVSHVDIRSVSEDGTEISDSELRLTGPMRTEITDADFLDDDTRMVASTYGGLLWWWDLDTDRATARICEAVGDPLTIDEAQALAPSLPADAKLCRS